MTEIIAVGILGWLLKEFLTIGWMTDEELVQQELVTWDDLESDDDKHNNN